MNTINAINNTSSPNIIAPVNNTNTTAIDTNTVSPQAPIPTTQLEQAQNKTNNTNTVKQATIPAPSLWSIVKETIKEYGMSIIAIGALALAWNTHNRMSALEKVGKENSKTINKELQSVADAMRSESNFDNFLRNMAEIFIKTHPDKAKIIIEGIKAKTE